MLDTVSETYQEECSIPLTGNPFLSSSCGIISISGAFLSMLSMMKSTSLPKFPIAPRDEFLEMERNFVDVSPQTHVSKWCFQVFKHKM